MWWTGGTTSIRKLTRNIDGIASELMGLENSLTWTSSFSTMRESTEIAGENCNRVEKWMSENTTDQSRMKFDWKIINFTNYYIILFNRNISSASFDQH